MLANLVLKTQGSNDTFFIFWFLFFVFFYCFQLNLWYVFLWLFLLTLNTKGHQRSLFTGSCLPVCLQVWCWWTCCSSVCVSALQLCLTAGLMSTGSCGRRRMEKLMKIRFLSLYFISMNISFLWQETVEKNVVLLQAWNPYVRFILNLNLIFDLLYSMCLYWGGEYAPQGIVGEEPGAHYHAQPGGLHGNSHLRIGHESHGRPGKILTRSLNHTATDHGWGRTKTELKLHVFHQKRQQL